MRICFLNMPIEYYSPVSGGAIATIIMQTANALLANGHEVTVVSPVDGEVTYPVGRLIPLTTRTRSDLGLIRRRISAWRSRWNRWDWPYYEYYLSSFTRALRDLRPAPDALVLFNDLVSPKYIGRVLPDTRLFVWLQNEQRTNQRDISETVTSTDRFLTCSRYIRDWTVQAHGIPADKFVVAPSGVDLERFYPRGGYLQDSNPLKVLFIGRIDRNKGPDIAADAVALLRAEGVPIRLTVAGGLWFYGHGNEMADPYFRELKQKMEAAGAEYLGHVTRPHVPDLVRTHDVTCVLSRSNEPFGLVVLEAMASGCAVVASNRGGLPEACGDAGKLVNPDDFQSVVAHLRSFASDPGALRLERQRSVARASRASWSVVADSFVSVLSGRTAAHAPSLQPAAPL